MEAGHLGQNGHHVTTPVVGVFRRGHECVLIQRHSMVGPFAMVSHFRNSLAQLCAQVWIFFRGCPLIIILSAHTLYADKIQYSELNHVEILLASHYSGQYESIKVSVQSIHLLACHL